MKKKTYKSFVDLINVRDNLRQHQMNKEDRRWEDLKDRPISLETDETAQAMVAITLEDDYWKKPNSKRTIKLRNIVYGSLCEFRRCHPVEIE